MYDNFAEDCDMLRLDGVRSERLNCAISRNDGRRDDRRTHAPRPKAEAKHGTGRGHIGQGTRTPRERDADTSGRGRGHLGQASLIIVLRVVGLFYKKKMSFENTRFLKKYNIARASSFLQKKKKKIKYLGTRKK